MRDAHPPPIRAHYSGGISARQGFDDMARAFLPRFDLAEISCYTLATCLHPLQENR